MGREYSLLPSTSSARQDCSRNRRSRLLLLATALVFACKTVAVQPPSAIPVPQGLAQSQVRIAIIAAVVVASSTKRVLSQGCTLAFLCIFDIPVHPQG